MLYTIFALPNIFATFIIGFLIDFLGVRIGIVALSIGVALFQCLVAIGGAYKSYTTMLIGRMLFGIASESLITAQASFVSFWFVGKELAFALGLAITIPELGNALNSYLTPIIFDNTQSLGPPLFTSVGVCSVSFLCAFMAAYLDKKADDVHFHSHSRTSNTTSRLSKLKQSKVNQKKSNAKILNFLRALSGLLWCFACLQSLSMYVSLIMPINSCKHDSATLRNQQEKQS